MKMTEQIVAIAALALLEGCIGLQARGSTADAAIAQQQSAVAAMQESIARQRAALQKQLGHSAAEGFFVLPPPVRMGSLEMAPAEPACDPLPEGEVRSLAGAAASREGLDADLLLNVMRQESGFRPCAISSKGAMGLMQLMPATADQFGVRDSFDPQENVGAGAKFLKELMARYNGDVFKAVSAYNAGPARVDAADGIPQIPETLDYIKRILYPHGDRQ